MELRETKEAVEIDPEKIKAFEELDPAPGTKWTPETDALLLKYWLIKKKKEVAQLLGINPNTCQSRYEKLIREQKSESNPCL